MRSALRRLRLTEESAQAAGDEEQPFTVGNLRIDPMRRQVFQDGSELTLTVLEFDLLVLLTRNPERPFTRMQLLDQVWDLHYAVYDRTVAAPVQRRPAKIELDPVNPWFIKTVWGVGYKFQPPEEH